MTMTNSQASPGSTPELRGEFAKRIFDLCVVLVSLPFLALPMLSIALAVRTSSPGPILYRGTRCGRYGEAFNILKFRTMIPAEPGAVEGTTSLADPRINRVGHVLRKYKLDELPQLFNVIRGEMSLVGPRPELFRYTDLYEGEELMILTVRPGITDYSSLKFRNLGTVVGSEDADKEYESSVLHEKNRLRVRYVKERTFWIDIRILAQTVRAILSV
jgi:lipopolysaccharide/colanic/teichoic acid biosynthesis glycosyltransferase